MLIKFKQTFYTSLSKLSTELENTGCWEIKLYPAGSQNTILNNEARS